MISWSSPSLQSVRQRPNDRGTLAHHVGWLGEMTAQVTFKFALSAFDQAGSQVESGACQVESALDPKRLK
jgi:hypothetical protein